MSRESILELKWLLPIISTSGKRAFVSDNSLNFFLQIYIAENSFWLAAIATWYGNPITDSSIAAKKRPFPCTLTRHSPFNQLAKEWLAGLPGSIFECESSHFWQPRNIQSVAARIWLYNFSNQRTFRKYFCLVLSNHWKIGNWKPRIDSTRPPSSRRCLPPMLCDVTRNYSFQS